MKKLYFICLLFISSCLFQNNKNSKSIIQDEIYIQFVEGSQDIPLIFGLEKIDEEALGFDSVGGSVISVSYKNKNISNEEIRKFYKDTLPQMGWKLVKSDEKDNSTQMQFTRNKEKLEIQFTKEKDYNFTRFYAELGI